VLVASPVVLWDTEGHPEGERLELMVPVPYTEGVARMVTRALADKAPLLLTVLEGERESRGEADTLSVVYAVAERAGERDAEEQIVGAPLTLGDCESVLLAVAVPHGEALRHCDGDTVL
jgi:hypothetical protein